MWTKRYFPLALPILACLFASSAAANAQDRPKGELFLGFSGRTNGDPILKGWDASAALHINEQLAIVADFSGHYGSLPGPGSITFANLTSFLQGIPSQTIPRSSNPFHEYSFLAGPQFSHRINGRARVFVRALFGATRVGGGDNSQLGAVPRLGILPTGPVLSGLGNGCIPNATTVAINSGIQPVLSFYPELPPCLSDTKIRFSFGAGGGLDVTVAKHWAIRVFQADYLNRPNVLGQGSNDFRLSSGLIYQW